MAAATIARCRWAAACTTRPDPPPAGDPAGTPSTNVPAQLLGPTGYAPPTFANAATVGAPTQALTLAPNELGITATTSGTATGPGQYGLKLRVECGGSPHSGQVKLVVLAGTSDTETILADGIGSGVAGCQ